MGNKYGKDEVPVLCSKGSGDFKFSVCVEAARAAAAVAMGSGTTSIVVGYSTTKTKEAGGASIQLRLEDGPPVVDACWQNVVVSLRPRSRMAFLPGVGAPLRCGTTVGLEVIVLARPDSQLQRVTQLTEDTLVKLYPKGDVVDVRILRPLIPYEPRCTVQWLEEHFVNLADFVEAYYGQPRVLPGVPVYEACLPDKESVVSWLNDAGLELDCS